MPMRSEAPGPWSLVFPLTVASLESNPSPDRKGEEEVPGRNGCPFHVHHLDFDFLCSQTERTYFQVFLPKGSAEKSKPMFFCRHWSVGKAVDSAATLAGLRNDNNKLTAKVTPVP